jgi:hypothetical protein
LESSFGPAKVKALFDQRIKNKEYNVKTELNNFDLENSSKIIRLKNNWKCHHQRIWIKPKTADARKRDHQKNLL